MDTRFHIKRVTFGKAIPSKAEFDGLEICLRIVIIVDSPNFGVGSGYIE